MFRGLMYGSYQKPRELVWILGMLIYLVLMAEAFMGYVLPWGQMSFWGAKVIISLFGAIPVIGNGLTEWIMGDYLPGDATLNRFFALHVIALPLVLLLLVVLHLGALHEVGSNNPDGVDIKNGPKGNRWDATKPADGIPFHPYYTVKDLFGVGFFLIICRVHHLLRAGLRRLVPGARQLHRGQPPGDAGAHQAGLVLHPVLRDVARHPAQAQRRDRDVRARSRCCSWCRGWTSRRSSRTATAASLTKIMLGMLAICFVWLGKIGAGPGTDPVETDHRPRADLPVLRLLHHHAAVDQARQDQAGAGTGDDA